MATKQWQRKKTQCLGCENNVMIWSYSKRKTIKSGPLQKHLVQTANSTPTEKHGIKKKSLESVLLITTQVENSDNW